jgi:hypothetical protein
VIARGTALVGVGRRLVAIGERLLIAKACPAVLVSFERAVGIIGAIAGRMVGHQGLQTAG